jgi:hypothetical protein
VVLRGWPTGRTKQLFERFPAVLLIKTNKKPPTFRRGPGDFFWRPDRFLPAGAAA